MDVRRKMLMKKPSSGGSGGGSTSGSYTVVLNDQWRLSTNISNPDSSTYEGVYESNSNYNVNGAAAIMYIDIFGLREFKLYIRSYAESYYDYVMVSQLDETIDKNTSYSDTTLIKAHTRNNQQSGTDINSYTLVEFKGLDGEKHRITIIYIKDRVGNSNQDRGYILIPKEQIQIVPEGPIDVNNYLTIEALEDGLTASLSMSDCEYCINGDGNWFTLTSGNTTQSINEGDTISFKSELTPNSTDSSSYGIGTFSINKNCILKGNCGSLLFGDYARYNSSLKNYKCAFYDLFNGCETIIEVSDDFLPFIELSERCYNGIFWQCTSLLKAPNIPATNIPNRACANMFNTCKSLIIAPKIGPIRPTGAYACADMFYGCSSLIDASDVEFSNGSYECCYYEMFCNCSSLEKTAEWLLATDRSTWMYFNMFSGCTNLKQGPKLAMSTYRPPTNNQWGGGMFSGCSNLNYIYAPITNWGFNHTGSWVSGVSKRGVFVVHPNYIPTGPGYFNTDYIPLGWIVANSEVEDDGDIYKKYLAIEALEDNLSVGFSTNIIQYSIDNGVTWTDLNVGSVTPNINSGDIILFKAEFLTPTSTNGIGTFSISKKCNVKGNVMSLISGDHALGNINLPSGDTYNFHKLFYGCKTIVDASELLLPATTLTEDCYSYMFYNCSALIYAPKLPATTLSNYCYFSMFYGCTSLTTAPELPATTLASYCYYSMFYGCSSLVTAPELPATTLASSCYSSMFYGCSSLVTAPELPATTLKDYCYNNMFRGCSCLVTAPELPATTLASSCYSSMFYGCKKLNYIKMLATNISAYNCLSSWVSNVSSTGTFVKHPNMTSLPTGVSGIPSGWTVYNAGDANEPERPELELPQVAGDVAYYTNGEIKTISASKWNSSLGTPIGVVVIPSNFLPDGKARILSLKAVDSSGNATISHSSMYWEQSSNYVDTTLTNYTKVPITNNTSSTSSSSSPIGYLPSDNFTGSISFVDSKAKYKYSTNLIPSPYNGNEFNTDYSKEISGNNALSDFNGLSNTQVLVGLGSGYVAANAAYNYNDGVSNTQWYLPSAGELGFMMARFKAINNTISQLGGVAVPSDDMFWSSTEYISGSIYFLNTDRGIVRTSDKGNNLYVRPFALLDNNGGV